MSESKKPDLKWPRIVIPRQVAVYAPLVPLRCVCVWLSDNGESMVEEVPVLGCQAVIAEHWQGRPISRQRDDPEPLSFTSDDLKAEGYCVNVVDSEVVDHQVLIWSEEYDCPLTLDSDLLDGPTYIVAPASCSEDWWRQRIEKRIAECKHSCARENARQSQQETAP